MHRGWREDGSGEGFLAPSSYTANVRTRNGDGDGSSGSYWNIQKPKTPTREQMKNQLVNSYQRKDEVISILPGYKTTDSTDSYRPGIKICEKILLEQQQETVLPIGNHGNNRSQGPGRYHNQESAQQNTRKASQDKYRQELDQQIAANEQNRKAEQAKNRAEANKWYKTTNTQVHYPDWLSSGGSRAPTATDGEGKGRRRFPAIEAQENSKYTNQTYNQNQNNQQNYSGNNNSNYVQPPQQQHYSGNSSQNQQGYQYHPSQTYAGPPTTSFPAPISNSSSAPQVYNRNRPPEFEEMRSPRQTQSQTTRPYVYAPPPPQYGRQIGQHAEPYYDPREDYYVPPNQNRQHHGQGYGTGESHNPQPSGRHYSNRSNNEPPPRSSRTDSQSHVEVPKDGAGDVSQITKAPWKPHPSQTTDQRRSKDDLQEELRSNLSKQIEERKIEVERQKRKREEEEIKLQKKIDEDNRIMEERRIEEDRRLKEKEQERLRKLELIQERHRLQVEEEAKARAGKRRFVPKPLTPKSGHASVEAENNQGRPDSRPIRPARGPIRAPSRDPSPEPDTKPPRPVSRQICPAKGGVYVCPEPEPVKQSESDEIRNNNGPRTSRAEQKQNKKLPEPVCFTANPFVAEIRPGSRPIRPAKCPINPEMFDDTSNPENAHLYHVSATVAKPKSNHVRKAWKKPGQEVSKPNNSEIGVETARSKSSTNIHKDMKSNLEHSEDRQYNVHYDDVLYESLCFAVERLRNELDEAEMRLQKYQIDYDMDIPEKPPVCPHANFSWA